MKNLCLQASPCRIFWKIQKNQVKLDKIRKLWCLLWFLLWCPKNSFLEWRMEAKLCSYTILRFWQYFLISEDPKYYIVRQSLWRLANKVLSNSYKFVFTKALKFPKHYARDCKSSARVFTKILKIPIFLLRNICIRVILRFDDMLTICWRYVDDMLTFWRYADFESPNTRSSYELVIYLFDNCWKFMVSMIIQQSSLHPCKKIVYLGMEIDSIKMTLSLKSNKL